MYHLPAARPRGDEHYTANIIDEPLDINYETAEEIRISSNAVARDLRWQSLRAQWVFEWHRRMLRTGTCSRQTVAAAGHAALDADQRWDRFSGLKSFKKVPEKLTRQEAVEWGFQGHSFMR